MAVHKESNRMDPGRDAPAVWVVPAALQHLSECGETDLVEELIAEFQTDTASRLETVGRAIVAADYATIRLEAHTIKGSAVQVGANKVADACRQVEVAARNTRREELGLLFRSLLDDFEDVRGAIAARHVPAPPESGFRRYGQ